MTYENLLVTNKDGKHPLLLGPVLVHQTKTLSPFHLFASTLIGLNAKVAEVKAFGSDGEPRPLVLHFKMLFSYGVFLTVGKTSKTNCMISACINQQQTRSLMIYLDDKSALILRKVLWMPKMRTPFGPRWIPWKLNGTTLKGAAFSRNQGFHFSIGSSNTIHAPTVDASKCTREGKSWDSTSPIYNHSESINNVIKSEVGWKESQLIEKLHNTIDPFSLSFQRPLE